MNKLSIEDIEVKNMEFENAEKAKNAAQLFNSFMVNIGYKTDVFFDCNPMIGIIEPYVAHRFHCVEYFAVENGPFHRVIFAYKEPQPLAQDTLVLDRHSGVYRYAKGELRESRNLFYPAGHCSRTWNDVIGGIVYLRDDQFEIIETPTDLETMQTPDEMCVQFKCKKYVNKYQRVESEKWLSGDCERCRISVSEPSRLKGDL